MIVVHKKSGKEYPVTKKEYDRLKALGMSKFYTIIDDSEHVVKEIKMPAKIEVDPMKLEVDELKIWLKDYNIKFDKRIKDIEKLQKLIP